MGQWHPAEPALPRCPPPPPAVAVGHVYLAAARHPLLRPHEPPHQLVVPQRLAAAEGDPLPRPSTAAAAAPAPPRTPAQGAPWPCSTRGRRRPRRCGRAATPPPAAPAVGDLAGDARRGGEGEMAALLLAIIVGATASTWMPMIPS